MCLLRCTLSHTISGGQHMWLLHATGGASIEPGRELTGALTVSLCTSISAWCGHPKSHLGHH